MSYEETEVCTGSQTVDSTTSIVYMMSSRTQQVIGLRLYVEENNKQSGDS